MTTIASFVLEIRAPDETPAEEGSAFGLEQAERRLLSRMPGIIAEIEENLTDLMPDGFEAKISQAQ